MLPKRARKELFYFLGRSLGVVDYSVPWKHGVVSGSVSDDVVFRTLFREGSFSDDLIEIFRSEHSRRPFNTFLDIGANIGLISIPMAVETGVTVHAFEPEPTNYRLLALNVERARLQDKIKLHNLALFDKEQELEFELSSVNHGDHRIKGSDPNVDFAAADRSARAGVIRVPGDRLDHVLSQDSIEWPLACKIDTQGAEPQIYAGGRKIFRKAELIVTEFWPYGINRIGGDVENLIRMLLEDFPKGGIRRPGKPYHDPDLELPSARLLPKLKEIVESGGMDDWCDLVLVRS